VGERTKKPKNTVPRNKIRKEIVTTDNESENKVKKPKKGKKLTKKALIQEQLDNMAEELYDDEEINSSVSDTRILKGDHWNTSLTTQLDPMMGMNQAAEVSVVAQDHGFVLLLIQAPGVGLQIAILRGSKQNYESYRNHQIVFGLVARTNGFHYDDVEFKELDCTRLEHTVLYMCMEFDMISETLERNDI
jgi:hypothetical protein